MRAQEEPKESDEEYMTNDELQLFVSQNKASNTQISENKSTTTTNRLSSFDICRGIIMIIMLIDHFDHIFTVTQHTGEYWTGIKPGYFITFNGNLSLAFYKFVLRWMASICAPGFFVLMGFGLLHFYHHRLDKLKWSKLQIMKYLFLRGILLLILDLTTINVLFALGTNLIFLTPIISIENYLYQSNRLYVSHCMLMLIMLFSIISTQLITPKYYEAGNIHLSTAQILFYTPDSQRVRSIKNLRSFPSLFSMIPWTSFAVIGIILGRIVFITKYYYPQNMIKLYKLIAFCGMLMLTAFAIIRYIGSLDFGNFGYPWYDEKLIGSPWIGMQFFLTTKYPPSLCYFLLWNGLIFIILSLIYYICDYNNTNNEHGKLYHIILVYGNTALFFYVIHYWLSVLLEIVLKLFLLNMDKSLWRMNIISIMVCCVMLLIMYPLCRWYKSFKASKPHTSYWKLF